MDTFDAAGRNVEVVFSFDTTGSMSSCLHEVGNFNQPIIPIRYILIKFTNILIRKTGEKKQDYSEIYTNDRRLFNDTFSCR